MLGHETPVHDYILAAGRPKPGGKPFVTHLVIARGREKPHDLRSGSAPDCTSQQGPLRGIHPAGELPMATDAIPPRHRFDLTPLAAIGAADQVVGRLEDLILSLAREHGAQKALDREHGANPGAGAAAASQFSRDLDLGGTKI